MVINMNKMSSRHNQILEILIKQGKIEVHKLSELFNVSQVTIRKDLDELENKGLITRNHGFATLNTNDDITLRLAYHYEQKQRIAKLACKMIKDEEVIMLESGSCCAMLADEIAKTKKDVTIITNSAFIASYVRKEARVHIILLGGEYQKEAQVNVGPITKKCAEVFHVDKFFIGIDGFSKDIGFTGNNYMRSETVKDLSAFANHVVVISDSSKFNKKSTVKLLPVNKIKAVITDNEISDDIVEYFKEHKIKLYKD